MKLPPPINLGLEADVAFRNAYFSSGPASFLAIFRREKMVPKISLASSSALRTLWPLDTPLACAAVELEFGRGVHRFL